MTTSRKWGSLSIQGSTKKDVIITYKELYQKPEPTTTEKIYFGEVESVKQVIVEEID